MPCPICFFPGNDAAATQCANCGSSLTPAAGAYPGSPVAAYEVNPISDPGVMNQPPAPVQPFLNALYPQSPPNPGQQFPTGGYPQQPPPPNVPQFPTGGYPQYPTGGYPQVPTGGYPQVPPVSGGAPYPGMGMPVSPQPISVTPISGSPQPGYYQPLKPNRARVLLPLTVIVVVLVIASTVIAVVKLRGSNSNASPSPTAVANTTANPANPVNPTSGPTTPVVATTTTPAADPKAQAAAVDALLDASISSRTKLNAAIDLVNKCTLIEKAISDMQTVGNERQSQIDSVGRFDLSAIPEGEQVRSMLKEALGFSLAADRNFVPWGQAEQSSGCSGGGQNYYDEAQRQSKNATDAKNRFLGVWNPVASRYGLRNRSSNDI
ncbi:MAG TPA: hypothetical protein VL738_07950 [Dactylosporangium sp.]|jgi:hypothetical protein|nr:hypothetical protein [Dactylosporangium sp.]